jgi:superfamily II DNA or RNA helicase
VIVRLVPTEFRANWYRDAPPEERDFGRLVEEMIADDARGTLLRRVILELVHEGDVPALVFTHRRDHAARLSTELLADGVSCGLMMGGEESAATFAEARELLERGKLLVAVGTFNAIGQGIDVPGLLAGVVGTPLGTNRQFFGQVRGRVCRASPGKTVGHLYYLWDREVFPRAPRNLIEWNDGKVEIFDRDVAQWVDADEQGDPA